jgi:radical SAM protein with 4Fe4S-binding SPASM domain
MIEQETTRHEVDAFIKKHYQRADIVSVNMLEYVNLENNSFGLRQRERKPLASCLRVSRNDCFICSNGHVTLCDAAYNGEIFLGDVHEETLYDIRSGDRRKKFLELNEQGRMMEMEFCRQCTDYDI